MIDHLSLGARDFARSTDFYTDVLGVLGYQLHKRTDEEAAFGPADAWTFFLYPAAPDQAVVGARMHIALYAGSRDAARAFHAAALSRGAESVRDVTERPEFGADYFGGMFRDPSGHLIEILTRSSS